MSEQTLDTIGKILSIGTNTSTAPADMRPAPREHVATNKENHMKKQLGFTVTELLLVLFFGFLALAGGVGWVWNIVKLVDMTLDPITGLLIVRVIGIFIPPLGAVVGYL